MLPDRRDDEYALACQLRAAGESLRAVEVLERHLAEDPRDPRAQTLLALCYDDVGQQARALEVVQDILAQDVPAKHRASLLQLQALYLEKLDRFREACVVLRTALRSTQLSRSQRANRLMLLGLTLSQRGRDEGARKALRSALALDPGNDEVQFHICVTSRSAHPRRNQLVLEGMIMLGDGDEAVVREAALSHHLRYGTRSLSTDFSVRG